LVTFPVNLRHPIENRIACQSHIRLNSYMINEFKLLFYKQPQKPRRVRPSDGSRMPTAKNEYFFLD